jgi:N-acetyl-anhydromuramyl-L-alanine amidase AmpD
VAKRDKTLYLVFHCSATKGSLDIGVERIREWHISKGWSDIGYHLVIRRDGRIEAGRHLDEVGAHVAGHNLHSIGVCMVGGLDEQGRSAENRPDFFTSQQWESAELVAKLLHRMYPGAQIVGHRDLSPDKNGDGKIAPGEWLKSCPCFDAQNELGKGVLLP